MDKNGGFYDSRRSLHTRIMNQRTVPTKLANNRYFSTFHMPSKSLLEINCRSFSVVSVNIQMCMKKEIIVAKVLEKVNSLICK